MQSSGENEEKKKSARPFNQVGVKIAALSQSFQIGNEGVQTATSQQKWFSNVRKTCPVSCPAP